MACFIYEKGKKMAEKLLQKLKDLGFEKVTINLWHESNLYVNIEGMKPFYYWLGGSAKICSRDRLDADVFAKARTLCGWISSHRWDLISQMGEGVYYRSDKMGIGE